MSQTGSSGRKVKMLFEKLRKINSGAKYPVNSSGLQYSLFEKTISRGPTYKSKSEQEERILIESEVVQGMLKKVAIFQVQPAQGEVLSNMFCFQKG